MLEIIQIIMFTIMLIAYLGVFIMLGIIFIDMMYRDY